MKYLNYGIEHLCPICGSSLRRFKTNRNRPNARCPVCGALERHRLLWLYCHEKTNLFDHHPKRMLHVAPEPQWAANLRNIPNLDYISVDINSPLASLKMDIRDLCFRDNSFDIIFCNHVLEHIPDDAQAMSELYRVLNIGGWAILQVPVKGETTLESASVKSPQERERLYGQSDHVRQYGKDYAGKLGEIGFNVTVDSFSVDIEADKRVKYGLMAEEDVYFCKKYE